MFWGCKVDISGFYMQEDTVREVESKKSENIGHGSHFFFHQLKKKVKIGLKLFFKKNSGKLHSIP